MQNPVQPTTSLTIAAVTYELLFDFEAVAAAEELTDRALLTGLRQRDINTPTISLVRAMLFACIHANHPAITYAEAKAFVTRKNLAEVWSHVLTAWTAGLAEPDPEEDAVEADPRDGPELTNAKRWLNLWSTARHDLHLSDEEFWHLTGRQLSALLKRHKQARDRKQLLVGLLASVTANFSMCRPKEPLTPADFMPKKDEPERSGQEVAEDFARMAAFCSIPSPQHK